MRAEEEEHFTQLLAAGEEKRKQVDGVAGDCDVWKEVGVVSRKSGIDNGIERVRSIEKEIKDIGRDIDVLRVDTELTGLV